MALKTNIIKVPLILLEGRADQRLYDGDVPADWSKSLALCTKYHLINEGSPSKFRAEYQNPFPSVWLTENNEVIQDCGWHFTWMGDENLKKYKAKEKGTSDFIPEIIRIETYFGACFHHRNRWLLILFQR